jgi:hypothetical protein
MKANMAEPIQIDLNAFYGGSIVPRCQDLLRILAIVALSFATIGCSLRQDRDAYAPVAWAERTPLSAIETAFAALNAPSTDTAAVAEPKVQGSCNDLEFAFLHATCSKKHKKRAWFKQHRVATFLVGRPDAITSSVKLPAQRAAVRQEIATDSDRRGKSEEKKPRVHKAGRTTIGHVCRSKQAAMPASCGSSRSTAKLQSGECRARTLVQLGLP